MQNVIKTLSFKNLVARVIAVCAALTVFALVTVLPLGLVAAASADKKVVVIDAGHGGADGGVTGRVSGVKESDLNLVIAKLLKEYLDAAGFKTVLTRKNAGGLYGGNLSSSQKRDDMFKRGEIISRSNPDAVVSIHMNYFNQFRRRGAQVFFDKSNSASAAFAKVMQGVLNDKINLPRNSRTFEPQSAEKYILSCSSAPTIIVECGFLSNAEDERLLTSPDFQSEIAHTIFQSIAIYLSSGT